MAFTLSILVTIVVCTALAYDSFKLLLAIVDMVSYPSSYLIFQSLAVILQIINVGILIAIMVVIIKAQRQGHLLIRKLLIASLCMDIAVTLNMNIFTYYYLEPTLFTEDYVRQQITELFRGVIYMIVWVGYFSNSIRAKCFFSKKQETIKELE